MNKYLWFCLIFLCLFGLAAVIGSNFHWWSLPAGLFFISSAIFALMEFVSVIFEPM